MAAFIHTASPYNDEHNMPHKSSSVWCKSLCVHVHAKKVGCHTECERSFTLQSRRRIGHRYRLSGVLLLRYL